MFLMPRLVLRQKINQNKYYFSVIKDSDKKIRWWVWVAIFCILFVDQVIKVWVKTNMLIGEEIVITDWFILHFVENNGFAFGLEFFGSAGKVLLTVFRVVFSFFVFRWLIATIRLGGSRWVVFAMILIFSGAVGNIIDSVFYGFVFDYAPLLFGRVVDMFYFPLIVEEVSGSTIFFPFIFNIADSCITIGAFILLFNYKHLNLK